MSALSAVARGRRAAERQMHDTFTAYSPNGRTPGPDGFEIDAFADEGVTRGKVSGISANGGDSQSRTSRVGEVDRPVVQGGLHIPIDAPVPTAGPEGVGWEYACTAVGPSSDPSLLGRRWRVVDVPAKSYATARRLDVVEIPQEAP